MDKKVIKLLLKEYLSLFLVFSLIQILFFGTLFFLKGIWIREVFYYFFLVIFIMTVYVAFRFYKRYRIYGKLFLETEALSDYLIEEPRGSMEEHFNGMIDGILKTENVINTRYDKEKNTQKMLIYRFIHQIKTPVSVINLIAEKHPEENDYEKIKASLDVIQENMNQLLTMYRLDDFKKDFISEKVNLSEICKEVINSLKDYFISMHVYPRLDIKEDIFVYSDHKWISLVIHQLLTNAIKYSHPEGIVSVDARKVEDEVVLTVTDNGVGINDYELSKIFDLFYIGENGRNNADSSGIGLYIAKSITDYLGHRLEINSDKAKKETIAKIIF